MKNLLRFSLILLSGILLLACSNEMASDSPVDKTADTSGNITQEEAIIIANKFIEAQGLFATTRANLPLEVVYTDLDAPENKTRATSESKENPSYYIINIGKKGYVVVSGSDATFPVLAYSTEGSFDKADIPTNMKDVLKDYESEVSYIRENNIKSTEETVAMRESYLEDSPNTRARAVVAPLLGKIKWNQSPYYNKYCPSGCPVGCVATATCQIMKYWEYPAQGQGSYSYKSRYGTLSFNYNYPLRWSNMPQATLWGPNDDVAKLSYGVAVSLEMQFSPQGSGAWQERVPTILQRFYKYPNTMKNVERKQHSASSWARVLMKELDAKRPIQYAGYGNGGGHSFVCDGYADNGYFHYNWGWGGKSDGYFLPSALNPGSLGTGGGSGGFNTGQTIVVGIQAPSGNGGGGDDDNDGGDNDGGDDNGGGNDGGGNDGGDTGSNDYGNYPETRALYSRTTFIRNVKIGSINNTTKSNAGGYNYFKDQTLTISPGYVYEIKLTPGFLSSSYREYWKACIDFNGDNKYTTDEIIAQGVTNGYESLVSRFRVPYVYSKSGIRMRVSMKWGGYPYTYETFKHGEVEDYNVVIR